MKKFAFVFVILLLTLLSPVRAQAQNVNWVALESDTTTLTTSDQLILLTLKGSLTTPINRVALILDYNPACFRVTSHHPGNLLPGAMAVIEARPGQFKLAYDFQGARGGVAGEGSLVSIQLESLKFCVSDISIAPDSISLGILDSRGVAANLTGVQYRSLAIHVAPGSVPPVIGLDDGLLNFMGLVVLALLGAALYRFLRSWPKRPDTVSSLPARLPMEKTPGLLHAGRLIPLLKGRILLGRDSEIIQRDGGFYLANTGVGEGTCLNGNHIGPGSYLLHDGDEVQIGRDVPYRFVNPEEHAGQLS